MSKSDITKADYRQLYQPSPDRLPRWVWRVWGLKPWKVRNAVTCFAHRLA